MTEIQLSFSFSQLPVLSDDERDDAAFRGKDRAWAALVSLYDEMSAEDSSLTCKSLGDRIDRSKSQVHRWLSSSCNMNLSSLSLLAEGLDADLEINVVARRTLSKLQTVWDMDNAVLLNRIMLDAALKDAKALIKLKSANINAPVFPSLVCGQSSTSNDDLLYLNTLENSNAAN